MTTIGRRIDSPLYDGPKIGVASDEVQKPRLPLLTQSSITTFRRCPREYFFSFVLNRKPRKKSAALRFGSMWSRGLNAWWSAKIVRDGLGMPTTTAEHRCVYAIESMHAYALEEGGFDEFDLIKAECLMAGYTARWGGEPYETIAVEKRINVAISDATSETYPAIVVAHLNGSIDALVLSRWGAEAFETHLHNVESKTTSEDISPGSNFWRRVIALDAQVSTYNAAAKAMGYDVRDTIYDATRKPELVPLKATPEELKKYTKPTKGEPIPRLYANQRETDETPDEYRARLTEDIIARPDWYYARQTIVRLEHDDEEHAKDIAQTARMIADAEERNAWPRSPNACERYRRLCDFFDVCSGESSIDDGTLFETKAAQHEELT